jgi:predicted O-methyltransferase YrrM
MNLDEALTKIAARLDLDADELRTFADEDDVGGYHSSPELAQWGMGSLWAVEGKILYALVRALRPASVLELGSYYGCSTAHIEAALKKNRKGNLTAVDNQTDGVAIQHKPGKRVEVVNEDGIAYLKKTRTSYDLIFEDLSPHSADVTAQAWEYGVKRLADDGVMVSHDAMHFVVGEQVRAGIQQAGIENPLTLLVEPSDCGLAVWRNG